MNGKRAEISNTSKHVVLVSSPLSVLSSFSLYCYSMASPRSAWHCMPALRALRSLRSLACFAWRQLGAILRPSWPPKNLPESVQHRSNTPPKTTSNLARS